MASYNWTRQQAALLFALSAELLWCLFLMFRVRDSRNRIYFYGSRIMAVLIPVSAYRAFFLKGHFDNSYAFWLYWQLATFPIPTFSISRYFHLGLGCVLLFAAPEDTAFFFGFVQGPRDLGAIFAALGVVYTFYEDFSRFDGRQTFGKGKIKK